MVVAGECQMRHTSAVVMSGLIMNISSKASIMGGMRVPKDCPKYVKALVEAGGQLWLKL